MPSIVNGLFAGRSGLASHGSAIAVVGDNISNSSTVGFKTSRAEFSDLMAGGQVPGKVIGSGSQLAGVSMINDQGTLEFTSRPLDLAIDGGGYFALADGEQRFYSRAGNFKVDASGFLVSQNGMAVMGFPAGGNGALEPINVNTVTQNSIETRNITISGNLDASAQLSGTVPNVTVAGAARPATEAGEVTYAQLNNQARFSTVVNVFDSLGQPHTVTYFFFRSDNNTYEARGYVNSEDVDTETPVRKGYPRAITDTGAAGGQSGFNIDFDSSGARTSPPAAGASDFTGQVRWNNGSTPSSLNTSWNPFTQYSAPSSVLSISQDGQGVGAVTSVSVQRNGDIFAILDNGQSSVIGTVGLVNFSNAEGLVRVGGNLLQKSNDSGEPIVGKPGSGKMGNISAGAIELSTVDIANEFVKLITLQRGFQANSRIITTINQLLNDIIQLA